MKLSLGAIQDMKHNLLLQAIHDKKVISFRYQEKQRIAEPHDYGIRNGSRRLLSFQIAGESASRKLPSWRLINVDEMEDLEITSHTFPGNRPTSGQHHQWDVLFARVGENVLITNRSDS
jgi:predicted DNA-binding transcriptional regulator YafY